MATGGRLCFNRGQVKFIRNAWGGGCMLRRDHVLSQPWCVPVISFFVLGAAIAWPHEIAGIVCKLC